MSLLLEYRAPQIQIHYDCCPQRGKAISVPTHLLSFAGKKCKVLDKGGRAITPLFYTVKPMKSGMRSEIAGSVAIFAKPLSIHLGVAATVPVFQNGLRCIPSGGAGV
jgi:hypothetical protein